MRPTRALGLVGLFVLASCATNPLCIPPPPHALPSRPRLRPAEEGVVAESRPSAVPEGFDAASKEPDWRAGDQVALALEFEDGGIREAFWMLVEVTAAADPAQPLSRATVRVTLLGEDGTEIGTTPRRIDPLRLPARSHEMYAAYARLVAAAQAGEAPESLQETIEDEMGEGTEFDECRKAWFREMRRTIAPRFLRKRLEEPALNSSLGGVSVLDVALSALVPPEVLVDVQRLGEEQALTEDFSDIPISRPIRLPFVFTLGGAIQLRFAITMTEPVPPYVLTGGILEIAGVNEARGDRRFLVRVVSAKRGAPESRPAESRPAPDPDDEAPESR
jgi:hypothetical protein